jgi:ComF family protein
MWKRFKKALLDFLFPRTCFGCQKEGSYLCEDCKATLEISSFHQKANLEWLSDLYFALVYQKLLIQKLIRQYKYQPFIKELNKTLASLIIEHFQLIDNKPDFTNFVLLAVPSEKKRKRWRGFNPAEEIGRSLAEFWEIPLMNEVLLKIKNTPPQVELSDKERKKNVKGAFVCQLPEKIKGRKILLVDDVFTTGATLTECARVLKKSGAKEIIGIVVARG